jgi:hypothetical protein
VSESPAATDGIEQYRGQSTLVSALAGAVVTVVTSFVPLSPILGGGVAAYLSGGDRSDGTRVGAISGAIATVPVLLGVVVLVGFVSLATLGVSPRAFGASLVFLLLLVVVFAVVVLYTVGLSALGGYLAVVLLEDRQGAAGSPTTDESGPVEGGVASTREDDESGEGGAGASDTDADDGGRPASDGDGEADAGDGRDADGNGENGDRTA